MQHCGLRKTHLPASWIIVTTVRQREVLQLAPVVHGIISVNKCWAYSSLEVSLHAEHRSEAREGRSVTTPIGSLDAEHSSGGTYRDILHYEERRVHLLGDRREAFRVDERGGTRHGSSGGSGSAVAANLAICAMGTDTTGSVRFPAAVNALVGMVAAQGLVSRAGIVPLTYSRDRGGPLCRTVRDAAAVLEVIVGEDPRDDVTPVAHGTKPVAYQNYASRKSLAGKRFGVVSDFMIEATIADRDSIRAANQALEEMKRLGATLATRRISEARSPKLWRPTNRASSHRISPRRSRRESSLSIAW
jgi:Amidase